MKLSPLSAMLGFAMTVYSWPMKADGQPNNLICNESTTAATLYSSFTSPAPMLPFPLSTGDLFTSSGINRTEAPLVPPTSQATNSSTSIIASGNDRATASNAALSAATNMPLYPTAPWAAPSNAAANTGSLILTSALTPATGNSSLSPSSSYPSAPFANSTAPKSAAGAASVETTNNDPTYTLEDHSITHTNIRSLITSTATSTRIVTIGTHLTRTMRMTTSDAAITEGTISAGTGTIMRHSSTGPYANTTRIATSIRGHGTASRIHGPKRSGSTILPSINATASNAALSGASPSTAVTKTWTGTGISSAFGQPSTYGPPISYPVATGSDSAIIGTSSNAAMAQTTLPGSSLALNSTTSSSRMDSPSTSETIVPSSSLVTTDLSMDPGYGTSALPSYNTPPTPSAYASERRNDIEQQALAAAVGFMVRAQPNM